MKRMACGWILTATSWLVFSAAHAYPAPVIVEVHTAAPHIIAVILQDTGSVSQGVSNPPALPVPNLSSGWTVNSQAPQHMYRYTVPFDQTKYTDNDICTVTVRHRIYLVLAQNLQENQVYAIATPYGTASLTFSSRTTYCEAVKVNQTGYNKNCSSRFANLGVYLGDGKSMTFSPVPAYSVVDSASGNIVASGTAVYMGADTAVKNGNVTSGEFVYRLSLNKVPEGGPYFVTVSGFGRSRSFGVGDSYSRQIAYVATRGLYHQRCGIALTQPYTDYTHAICHPQIATYLRASSSIQQDELAVPKGTPLYPMSGGYHDAGDMDHNPTHTIISILMLSCFEAWPGHFIDNQYNIPESGNGVPDFLDETMWGIRIWENLQITDPNDQGHSPNQYGGVMGGWSTEGVTGYGTHGAANDPHVYGSWEVMTDHTALCAGIFAQASRLLRPYDAVHADSLANRARIAWAYLAKTTDVRALKTSFMYAALQLYLATGDTACHAIFKNDAQAVVINNTAGWPEEYLPGNISASCQTAHFVSYLLSNGRSVDAALAQALKNKLFEFANNETYMGPPPENQPYPQGVTRFMGWGAATAQGRYADVFAFAHLFSADAAKKQAYFNAVSQYADYSLGLNPMGISYFTGLGTDQPQSPCQCNSFFTKYGFSDGVTSPGHQGHPIGNVPGILIYGPTDGRSGAQYQLVISNQLYPAWDNLPLERRWGDGWSLINGNEFTVWETVCWAVTMHGFLYDASADAAVIRERPGQSAKIGHSAGFGISVRDRFITCQIREGAPAYLALYDLQGRVIRQIRAAGNTSNNSVLRLNIATIRNGAYVARAWANGRSACACLVLYDPMEQ